MSACTHCGSFTGHNSWCPLPKRATLSTPKPDTGTPHLDAYLKLGAGEKYIEHVGARSTPADIHYDPTKPACLKHGYGHWTKDCPDLTGTQELREAE